MLTDRYVIRVFYHGDVYDTGLLKGLKATDRTGYVCAVNQSYMCSDSAFKPEASIALYTLKRAEAAKKELVRNWQRRVTECSTHSYWQGQGYPKLSPGFTVDDHIPKIDIIRLSEIV